MYYCDACHCNPGTEHVWGRVYCRWCWDYFKPWLGPAVVYVLPGTTFEYRRRDGKGEP